MPLSKTAKRRWENIGRFLVLFLVTALTLWQIDIVRMSNMHVVAGNSGLLYWYFVLAFTIPAAVLERSVRDMPRFSLRRHRVIGQILLLLGVYIGPACYLAYHAAQAVKGVFQKVGVVVAVIGSTIMILQFYYMFIAVVGGLMAKYLFNL